MLRVRDLRVSYGVPGGRFAAVDGISFEVGRAEALALIGESGSGKSTIALSLLRLLPEDAHASGRVELLGEDLLELPEASLSRVRGSSIAMVFHDPLAALNPVMAACKATMDAAHGVAGSTLVTAMARNGTEFGIRVSGLGDRWFTAPAETPHGLYFPGFTAADANPDVGDSAITETAGVGAFAMAAAPAIVKFVSGTARDALTSTLEMYEITLAENPAFGIPALDFRGTPTGIDIRRVARTGILPRINTGIAHRTAGIGQIGAGLVRPPRACFDQAVAAMAAALGR